MNERVEHKVVELLELIAHELKHANHLQKENMIAQASLDASLQGLTKAVANATAALATASTATSTPDAVVSAFQSGVDAQTAALATATPPPPPPAPGP